MVRRVSGQPSGGWRFVRAVLGLAMELKFFKFGEGPSWSAYTEADFPSTKVEAFF